MTNRANKMLRIVAVAALLPLGACSDLLKVTSPGNISDSDLGTKDAIPGMVTGMQWTLSNAVDHGNLEFLEIASGEMYHGGSYSWNDVPRGVIVDDDPGVNPSWSDAQQARWVAENGIERMKELLGDGFSSSAQAAQAYIYAGYANRILGANFCNSVIDGGPEVANTEHFTRAMDEFTQAISIAQAAGATELVNEAYAGRAQIEVLTNDWANAAADAAKVPTDFVFNAAIDTEMRNDLWYETHTRNEYSVWGTYMESHTDDPRAPWVIARNADGTVASGANGTTPHYRQEKYTGADSDVPLAKGTEMLEVRAEAALRSNDIAGAYGFMNQARDFYGMAALPVAANMDDAWADLHYERAATLWLETRRLEDLRRWYADSGPAHVDYLADRAKCIPIPQAEKLANPNFRG